jgi:outer membrane cobalamin receptor
MATAFTLLRTKLEGSEAGAGGQLPRRPAAYGSAGITWDVLSELSLDGVVTYVGRRNDRRYFADFTSQEERLGGYAKLDLTGRYELPLSLLSAQSLELTGHVENALNRRYEAVAGFESPGRRFLLGVRLSVDY